jgi:hypothetical protein
MQTLTLLNDFTIRRQSLLEDAREVRHGLGLLCESAEANVLGSNGYSKDPKLYMEGEGKLSLVFGCRDKTWSNNALPGSQTRYKLLSLKRSIYYTTHDSYGDRREKAQRSLESRFKTEAMVVTRPNNPDTTV